LRYSLLLLWMMSSAENLSWRVVASPRVSCRLMDWAEILSLFKTWVIMGWHPDLAQVCNGNLPIDSILYFYTNKKSLWWDWMSGPAMVQYYWERGLSGWTVWRSYDLVNWTSLVSNVVRSKDYHSSSQWIDGSINLNVMDSVFYKIELRWQSL
jgi:hypothetical protein